MSSTSMDEDEPIAPLLYDENNENYMETCDDDVNDIVPRLERLSINDNEPSYLPSSNMSTSDSSMSIVPSSMNNSEEVSMNVSSENVSPVFGNDASDMISVDIDTEAAVGSQISLSRARETSQLFPTNTQGDIKSQELIQKTSADREINAHRIDSIDIDTEGAVGSQISLSGARETSQVFPPNIQVEIKSQELIRNTSADGEINTHLMDTKEEKILNIHKESQETEVNSIVNASPTDLSLKSDFDPNNAANLGIAVSENKNELPLLIMVVPEKMDHTDPETGEISEHSSNLPVASGSNSKGKTLDQLAAEMSNDIISDLDSSKLTYFADISSDDQSNRGNGIVDSSSDIGESHAALVQNMRTRKIAIVPPDSVINEIRQRHIQQSNIKDASNTTSSDEDNTNSNSTWKSSSMSTRRKCKKVVKSSPRPINLNNSDIENEEKGPSPCKRKNSATMTETSGKFRKRSMSEYNSESGEKTRLAVRSRSLSPVLNNIEGASIRNSPTKHSVPQKSRKRTNSGCSIESRVKIRRPSTSSDEAENK